MAVGRILSGIPAEKVLVISASRTAAARMRQDLSTQLRSTASQPLARSAASTAFSIVRAWAVANGEPPPVPVSGPAQDAALAALLAGHLAAEGRAPSWPEAPAVATVALTSSGGGLRGLLSARK